MSGHNHNQADRAACGEPAPYGSDVCERPPYHPGEHTRAGHSWTRGVVVSGDQLNLDAIEAQTRHRAQWGDDAHCETVLALVAEVRRLRAELDMSERLLATMDMWADVAETCERKANESHARREEAEAELAALRASIAAQA